MSLINDALKKAQRQRAEPAAGGVAAPGPQASRVEKRGRAMRSQTLILLVAGAAVLVILSVAATVYLLNRPASPPVPAIVVAKPPVAAPDSPGPVIVLPVTSPPVAADQTPSAALAPSPTVGSRPAAPRPGATAGEVVPATALPLPPESLGAARETTAPAPGPAAVASSPAAQNVRPETGRASPSAAPPPTGPDARLQLFVDSLRVTGIRSSGADSKVLMNDRVYRVNDVVERTLGLKLVKVESDQLSFTDANGFVYTKNF